MTFRTKKKIRARKTLAASTELAKKTAHSSASFVNVIKNGPEGTLKFNLDFFLQKSCVIFISLLNCRGKMIIIKIINQIKRNFYI